MDHRLRRPRRPRRPVRQPLPNEPTIKVTPTKITLKKDTVHTSSVWVPAEEPMMVKVMASDIREFHIRPAYGFVDAGKPLEITIFRNKKNMKRDRMVICYGQDFGTSSNPKEAYKKNSTIGTVQVVFEPE